MFMNFLNQHTPISDENWILMEILTIFDEYFIILHRLYKYIELIEQFLFIDFDHEFLGQVRKIESIEFSRNHFFQIIIF